MAMQQCFFLPSSLRGADDDDGVDIIQHARWNLRLIKVARLHFCEQHINTRGEMHFAGCVQMRKNCAMAPERMRSALCDNNNNNRFYLLYFADAKSEVRKFLDWKTTLAVVVVVVGANKHLVENQRTPMCHKVICARLLLR